MVKQFWSWWESRWMLLAVLLAFICFKIPHLYYPYLFDESWVYVRAVKIMAINGPSLLPGSIPADCGRGHPLLLPFLSSLWIRGFGTSNFAVHSFQLLLSVAFLIAIYGGCRRLFGSRAATLALLLVATNVLFFVQSAFVFPEVMVAMFAFLSLCYYSEGRLLPASAMLFLLFFTKECGLVFGAVIGADAVVSLFRNQESMRRRLLRLAAVAVPALLIGSFFVLQKARMGWYLLPEHTGLIHAGWNAVYDKFRDAVYWTFRGDPANNVLSFFVIALSVVPAIRHKNVRYLFLCLPAIAVYTVSDNGLTHIAGGALWVCMFLLFFAIAIYYVLRLNKNRSKPGSRFILLAGIGFVLYLYYSSLTIIAYRYLLVDVILALVFFAVCIDIFVSAAGSGLFYVAVVGILAIGVYAFYSDEGNTDADLDCFHVMKVEQNEISYLEKNNAYDKEIVIGCFSAVGHFTDTLQGFLGSGRAFTRVKHQDVVPGTEYAVFDDACAYGDHAGMLKNPDFHLVYKTRDGNSWGEIYKRN